MNVPDPESQRRLAELASRQADVSFAAPARRSPLRVLAGGVVALAFLLVLAELVMVPVESRRLAEGGTLYPMHEAWQHDLVASRDTMYRMKPNRDIRAFRTNSHGFKEPEVALGDPEGVVRLTVIGDSTVFGDSVPLDETWLMTLERLIEQRSDLDVETVNLAQIVFSSEGAMTNLRNWGDRFGTDVLVVGVGAWNDYQIYHEAPDMTERELVENGFWYRRLLMANSPLRHSRLYRLWRWRFWTEFLEKSEGLEEQWRAEGAFAAESTRTRRVSPEEFRENLNAMCDWAEMRDVPVFFLVPTLSPGHPNFMDYVPENYPIADVYRAIVMDVCERRRNAHAVRSDRALHEMLRFYGTYQLWWDWVHWSPIGHEYVAETVYETMRVWYPPLREQDPPR